MITKICTKCNEEKELDCFHNSKDCQFGKSSMCKKCNCLRVRKYQKENRKKRNEYNKEWFLKNPEKHSLYSKRKYEKNKKVICERNRLNKKNNKDKFNQISNIWMSKGRANLSDYYMRALLKNRGIKQDQITQELIEVQRLITQTKRLCKTSQS